MAVKVGIVGYGTIGKRVADAVSLQDDMELVGISARGYDWRYAMAVRRGYKLYFAEGARMNEFEEHGVELAGSFEDLIEQSDVIVDCSPKKVAASHKPLYEKHGKKAIFEGGEKHDLTGVSFNSSRNYEESWGKQFTRVVSCNTTSLSRVVGGIHEKLGIKKARITLVRRATDPWESHKKGIINTVVPSLSVPSHHAGDLQTVVKDIDVTTIAFQAAHNMMHINAGFLEMKSSVAREDVVKVLEEEKRVVLVNGKDRVEALNSIFALARDLNRSRGDVYEIPVWEDSIKVENNEVYLIWATPNESNVIPENIDAIRSLTQLLPKDQSMEKTDKSLGVLSTFY